jgi:Domain of unknown function (DUF4180)
MYNTLSPSIYLCSDTGPVLCKENDWTLFLDEAGGEADTIVVPVSRFSDDFFTLSTGLLGAVTQKFATYRIRLVVLGDISLWLERSKAFRDYVREVNQGNAITFTNNTDKLKDLHA